MMQITWLECIVPEKDTHGVYSHVFNRCCTAVHRIHANRHRSGDSSSLNVRLGSINWVTSIISNVNQSRNTQVEDDRENPMRRNKMTAFRCHHPLVDPVTARDLGRGAYYTGLNLAYATMSFGDLEVGDVPR